MFEPERNLTGAEIRQLRHEARDITDVLIVNHPSVIGVITPPWMWRRLMAVLDKLSPFDPFSYDYITYDPSKPRGVYSGDRMLLKELFAGSIGAEYNTGTKIDGTTVDETTFRNRAAKYLVSVISQIAQVERRRTAVVEEPRPKPPDEATGPVPAYV